MTDEIVNSFYLRWYHQRMKYIAAKGEIIQVQIIHLANDFFFLFFLKILLGDPDY